MPEAEEEEEEGCQRIWIDCSSSRHSDGFVRQKLRRPGLLMPPLPPPLLPPLLLLTAFSFLLEGLFEKQRREHRRQKASKPTRQQGEAFVSARRLTVTCQDKRHATAATPSTPLCAVQHGYESVPGTPPAENC